MFRKLAIVITLIAVLIAGMTILSAPLQAAPAQDESAFVRDINNLRASKGVGPLTVDARLTAMARDFAVKMAASGGIYHNPDLASQAPGEWRRLGENVGVGYDEPGLHVAFVNSSGHYRNLVDPQFNAIGVGVVYSGGRMWVVEDFMYTTSAIPELQPSKPALVTDPAARSERYRQTLQNHQ